MSFLNLIVVPYPARPAFRVNTIITRVILLCIVYLKRRQGTRLLTWVVYYYAIKYFTRYITRTYFKRFVCYNTLSMYDMVRFVSTCFINNITRIACGITCEIYYNKYFMCKITRIACVITRVISVRGRAICCISVRIVCARSPFFAEVSFTAFSSTDLFYKLDCLWFILSKFNLIRIFIVKFKLSLRFSIISYRNTVASMLEKKCVQVRQLLGTNYKGVIDAIGGRYFSMDTLAALKRLQRFIRAKYILLPIVLSIMICRIPVIFNCYNLIMNVICMIVLSFLYTSVIMMPLNYIVVYPLSGFYIFSLGFLSQLLLNNNYCNLFINNRLVPQ